MSDDPWGDLKRKAAEIGGTFTPTFTERYEPLFDSSDWTFADIPAYVQERLGIAGCDFRIR